MNKLNKLKLTLALSAMCLLMQSCQKDEAILAPGYNEYSRPLEIAAPIFSTKLDVNALFNQFAQDSSSVLRAGENGLLHVYYRDTSEIGWEQVLDFNMINHHESNSLPFVKGSAVDLSFAIKQMLTNQTDQRIDSIVIDSMPLNFNVSALQMSGSGIIKMNNIRRAGVPFTLTWTLADGCSTRTDLSGYTIYPNITSDGSSISIDVTMHGTALTNQTQQFDFNLESEKLVPQIAYGYLGKNVVLTQSNSRSIVFFKDYDIPHEIEFAGASVNIDVLNHTGIPYKVSVTDMNFYYKKEFTPLIFNVDNSLNIEQIPYTTSLSASNLEPKHNKFSFDSTNSTIQQVINLFPDKFTHTINIETNPEGEKEENFITKANKMSVVSEVNIPIHLRINNLLRFDTIQFNLSSQLSNNTIESIDSLSFIFTTENLIPIDVYSQAYLMSESGEIVDSLTNTATPLWKGCKLNNNMLADKPAVNIFSVTLDNQRATKCLNSNVTHIVLKSRATTRECAGNSFIPLYKNYYLKLSMAVEAKSNTNLLNQ